MFESSNLSYLTFFIVLLFLACLNSRLDSKTSSQHNLIFLAIYELQHPAMVKKNISKHKNDPNYKSKYISSFGLFKVLTLILLHFL
jgi:hypothetical protein